MDLFEPITLRSHEIRNRIAMPPIVVFWADGGATVTDRHVAHYRRRAEGGVGLIVVEATAVMSEGRLSDKQLGIWSDEFIPGLARIRGACHDAGAVVLIQIHHAGLKSPESVTGVPVAPSDTDEGSRHARGLDPGEIEAIREAFISAAIRAHEAGFDGVELHGAHGYLLNQFASPRINLREDEYGGSLEGRIRLARGIVDGIRRGVGDETFIVSCRMGCNDPDLEGSIAIARHLVESGVDMLHVSSGMGDPIAGVPDAFPHNWIVYGGASIGRAVDVPVIAVNGIRTPGQARNVLEQGADFIAMARALLVDPDWPAKAERNESPVSCLECKPRCSWFENGERCPRFDRSWLPGSE